MTIKELSYFHGKIFISQIYNHTSMKKTLLITIVLMLYMLTAQSQNTLSFDENESSPNAQIEDVAWIAGHWRGEAFGGVTEEIWSPPMGNAMMAVFRLVNENQTDFYEIETISEENGSLILRLKHFGADLKGWEEKDETVDFPLVKLEPNKAYFDGMTFEKVSKDAMNIYVLMKYDDGSEKEMAFAYGRVK